jgi:Domain of unknown function (DUF4136)
MINTYSYLLRCLLLGSFILFTTVIYAEQETTASDKFGSSFSWLPSGTFFYDAARFRDSDIKSLLENSIINELEAKGYRYLPAENKIDFYVSYIVILEEKLDDSEIANLMNKYPEINLADTMNSNFEHGTFIISAVKAPDRGKLWKNTLNEFVYLQMPKEIRQQRLQEGIKQILESFPVVN